MSRKGAQKISGLLQNFLVQRVEKSGLTPYGTECYPRGFGSSKRPDCRGLSPLGFATVRATGCREQLL
jgi:hypothetical protein